MSSLKTFAIALLMSSFFAVGQTHGAIIPGLFTTGVDSGGNTLGSNANDPHYALLAPSGPAKTISTLPFVWVPNNSTSRWVWQTALGTPTGVTLTFRTTFDLSGLLPTTAQISGTWITDNFGSDIFINGTSTGNTDGGFAAFSNFTINSGFVPGINTLDFVVTDLGSVAGFRVGMISGTATEAPEPSAFALSGLGLALLAAWWPGRLSSHSSCTVD